MIYQCSNWYTNIILWIDMNYYWYLWYLMFKWLASHFFYQYCEFCMNVPYSKVFDGNIYKSTQTSYKTVMEKLCAVQALKCPTLLTQILKTIVINPSPVLTVSAWRSVSELTLPILTVYIIMYRAYWYLLQVAWCSTSIPWPSHQGQESKIYHAYF